MSAVTPAGRGIAAKGSRVQSAACSLRCCSSTVLASFLKTSRNPLPTPLCRTPLPFPLPRKPQLMTKDALADPTKSYCGLRKVAQQTISFPPRISQPNELTHRGHKTPPSNPQRSIVSLHHQPHQLHPPLPRHDSLDRTDPTCRQLERQTRIEVWLDGRGADVEADRVGVDIEREEEARDLDRARFGAIRYGGSDCASRGREGEEECVGQHSASSLAGMERVGSSLVAPLCTPAPPSPVPATLPTPLPCTTPAKDSERQCSASQKTLLARA